MGVGSNGDTDEGINGINVTPLVDITLVLLIIFMVTTKMIVQSQSMPLDLPKAASGSEIQTVFSVELYTSGETVVDKNKLGSDDAVLGLARDAHGKNSELRAVIKADAEVKHGRVIHVLDLLKQAGVSKIAFAITPVAPEPGALPAPSPSK
jgi:biopolymer transport protein ExbD